MDASISLNMNLTVNTFMTSWFVLPQVSYLVLDEADKLLAMGFTAQVDAVLAAATHPGICRAFFSATLPDKVTHVGLPIS